MQSSMTFSPPLRPQLQQPTTPHSSSPLQSASQGLEQALNLWPSGFAPPLSLPARAFYKDAEGILHPGNGGCLNSYSLAATRKSFKRAPVFAGELISVLGNSRRLQKSSFTPWHLSRANVAEDFCVLWGKRLPTIIVKEGVIKTRHRRVAAVSTFDGSLASEVLTSLPSSVPCHIPTQCTVIPSQSPILKNRTISPQSDVLLDSFSVAGGSTLSGHVHISGAKNSALAVLAGVLCSTEEVYLRMVPDLLDIQRMFQVLRSLGVRIQQQSSSDILIDATHVTSMEPCCEAAKMLRASFFVIGALVGRLGEAVVALPGGCNIGARPIDLHLRGLEALGAEIEVRQGKVYARATNGKRLKGGTFYLDYPSVGATETLIMAASLADGQTVLLNVAQEPEVVDLAEFLNSCGACIQGAGTSTLVINGMRKLHSTEFTIIPDRIEAGTFLVAAAITRSAISLSPVVPHHLTAIIDKLRAIGCNIHQLRADTLLINSSVHLQSLDLTTKPYPGFPTDLQPQLMSLLVTCCGLSVLTETVFESRMGHVEELQKLGAKIKVSRNKAVISGSDMGSLLCGASVKANDLRAGAALVLAGMAAEGSTFIEGVSHIDRGYERIDEKLRLLGADIDRLP